MNRKLPLGLLFFSLLSLIFAKPYPDYPMLDQYRKEDPIEVLYVEPKELSRYRVTFAEESRVLVGGKIVESNSLTFVMDKEGNIYASPDKMYLHHSSYLRGQSVACAGHLFLIDGVLSTVMNSSGHYAPPAKSLVSVAEELMDRGIDIEGLTFLPVQALEIKDIEAEIRNMISQKKKAKKIKEKGCRSILDQILG